LAGPSVRAVFRTCQILSLSLSLSLPTSQILL
jgi:hypothetical protein